MPRIKQTDRVSSSRGVFITATDTGVGKTVVTAALAVALRSHGHAVGVMKPIETGVTLATDARSDAVRLGVAAGSSNALAEIRPYVFRLPLAPMDAARLEKRKVMLPTIMRAFRMLQSRHKMLLVEGLGGLYVPISSSLELSDIMNHMNFKVIVVGRASLGGINHALLTIEALRRRNIPILALVLNRTVKVGAAPAQLQESSTLRLLRQFAGVPVIGPLPYRSMLERNFQREVARLAKTVAITKLMRMVLASGPGMISRHD